MWRRHRCLNEECGQPFFSKEHASKDMKFPHELTVKSLEKLRDWQLRSNAAATTGGFDNQLFKVWNNPPTESEAKPE
jgi:hypothetical protein